MRDARTSLFFSVGAARTDYFVLGGIGQNHRAPGAKHHSPHKHGAGAPRIGGVKVCKGDRINTVWALWFLQLQPSASPSPACCQWQHSRPRFCGEAQTHSCQHQGLCSQLAWMSCFPNCPHCRPLQKRLHRSWTGSCCQCPAPYPLRKARGTCWLSPWPASAGTLWYVKGCR